MLVLLIVALVAIVSISIVKSECANACNGHGRCTSYDMCICNRNWQAADCSERVCLFGLAHVDTPKGDLNGNGMVDSPDKLLIENSYVWPYGTTEQFPAMEDSDLNPIPNSAHYYTECSNKGKCDRSSGDCVCYDGYDGVACQRASCPGYPASCSGHGVCKTIKQLAASDNGNVYSLWDQDKTMGCECDAGYYGPDCSLRQCKVGVDPLYLDDISTVKYSVFDFATIAVNVDSLGTVVMNQLFHDGTPEKGTGYFVLRFFDSFGEDWVTEPLPGGASCEEIVEALYNLPNDVIPMSSLHCSSSTIVHSKQQSAFQEDTGKWYEEDHPKGSSHPVRIVEKLAFWEAYEGANDGELSFSNSILHFPGSNTTYSGSNHAKFISGFFYRIKFFGNPGALKVPQISVYLDGKRPSLVSSYGKVVTKVWTDGQQGEYSDYFADHCDGVMATIGTKALKVETNPSNPHSVGKGLIVSYLTGMTMTQKNLLKACLGNSDFTSDNNMDVYNWDIGSKYYPHIIKLVRSVTTYTDGGYYAVVWYDKNVFWDMTGSEGTFRILNPFMPPDNFKTDKYDIYTTQGTLALTSDKAEATFGFASNYIYMVNTTYDTAGFNITSFGNGVNSFDGDISCVVGNNDAYRLAKDGSGNPLYIQHCLNTTDMFTLLNWEEPWMNPHYINLYSAERLFTQDYSHSVGEQFSSLEIRNQRYHSGPPGDVRPFHPVQGYEMHYMTHMITTDIPTNWAVSKDPSDYWRAAGPAGIRAPFHIYKFFPAAASTYNYVAPCSNRGICDTDSGLCSCFPGYTNDDCSEQAALHV